MKNSFNLGKKCYIEDNSIGAQENCLCFQKFLFKCSSTLEAHSSLRKRAAAMCFFVRKLIFCCMWENERVDTGEWERGQILAVSRLKQER